MVFMMIDLRHEWTFSRMSAIALLAFCLTGCGDGKQYREVTDDTSTEPLIESSVESEATNATVEVSEDNSDDLAGAAVETPEGNQSSNAVTVATDAANAVEPKSTVTNDAPTTAKASEITTTGESANTDESEGNQTDAVQASVTTDVVQTSDRSTELANLRAQITGGEGENVEREIKLLIPEKTFETDNKTGKLRMTFDDLDLLKILNMEPIRINADEYLPDWLKEMDGKEIVLKGFMYPSEREVGIRHFLFTRDNGTCCFGPNAKIYDKVWVDLKDGESTHLIFGRPFEVVGTFAIEPEIFDDKLELLYHIQDAVVLER